MNRASRLTNQDKAYGYTILELAVVIAILSAIAGIAFPSINRWIALARIDSVKTLLNSAAAECLQGIREGNSPEEIPIKETTVSNATLGSYGYKIKESDKSCASYFVIPTNEDETFMYQLGFKINSLGEIAKIAVPASDSGSLNSCKNWAGINCGVSAEQQAVWDALAKIEKDKKTCNDKFYAWLQNPQKPGSGPMNRWDDVSKSCSLETWAFEGSIQKDEAAYKDAEKAKYGAICGQKTTAEKEKKTTQGPVKIAECGEREFYFCLGDDKGTLEAMNECRAANQEAKCISDRENARTGGYKGKYGPIVGPGRCGEVRWICNGFMFETELEYTTSACSIQTCIEPPKQFYCPFRPEKPECRKVCP